MSNENEKQVYDKRYVANIVFEAKSPLKVGSSENDILQDAPIQKDWNNLPMILGSSIAGVLRHSFSKDRVDDVFGDEDGGEGSRLIVSNALLCDENMKVCEELLIPNTKSKFLKIFENLPIREHTKITDKGVADSTNSGKFDEQVVYEGARFKFRLEFIANENDEKNWQEILDILCDPMFRLGGGNTKGFGEIRILRDLSRYIFVDLNSDDYRNESSSLNLKKHNIVRKDIQSADKKDKSYVKYELNIKPDNFFMFGSGFGDDDADMTPVFEKVVDYSKKDLSEKKILIPASSIKGALSHRTAFHYNYIMMKNDKNYEPKVAEKNLAVKEIFGQKKDEIEGKKVGQKGRVFMSDCILENNFSEKVFDHVSIDRFTGGGIEGALFQEKTVSTDNFSVLIYLKNDIDDKCKEAFEFALKDIVTGMLPLGGTTTKGHGVFLGRLLEDKEVKYENR